jgi:hypothetical protein
VYSATWQSKPKSGILCHAFEGGASPPPRSSGISLAQWHPFFVHIQSGCINLDHFWSRIYGSKAWASTLVFVLSSQCLDQKWSTPRPATPLRASITRCACESAGAAHIRSVMQINATADKLQNIRSQMESMRDIFPRSQWNSSRTTLQSMR